MKPSTWKWWIGAALTAGLLTGCVDRRFIITTEFPGSPPGGLDAGAIVYDEKGLPVGASPVDRQFTYYGKYRFTLVKDGCQTMVVEENVRPPFYEWFGLDFISENLIPFTIRDVRRFHYKLQPVQIVPAEAVLQQAQIARDNGQKVGPPPNTINPGLAPQMPPANSSNFPPPGQPFMPPATDGPRINQPAPPTAAPVVAPVPPASTNPAPGSPQLFPLFPETPPPTTNPSNGPSLGSPNVTPLPPDRP